MVTVCPLVCCAMSAVNKLMDIFKKPTDIIMAVNIFFLKGSVLLV